MKTKTKKYYTDNIIAVDIPRQTQGVRVGKIVHIDESGHVFIDFSGNTHGKIAARFTSSVQIETLRHAHSTNQDVLVVFENNDDLQPIIINTVSTTLDEIAEIEAVEFKVGELKNVLINGKELRFDANKQIELRCGKASIKLNSDGKIIIKGTDLVSRSSKSNKIKGASVQIN